MTLPELAPYAWLITTMIGVVTLIVGVATFAWKVRMDGREATLKRFDKFLQMEKEADTKSFRSVLALVYDEEPEDGKPCDIHDKEEFMDFYEQIALLVNSNLMTPKFALYMYGADAIQANYSEAFWAGMEQHKTDPFWLLFRDFCHRMERLRNKYPEGQMPVRKFRL